MAFGVFGFLKSPNGLLLTGETADSIFVLSIADVAIARNPGRQEGRQMIKFNLHNVVNTETGAKARIRYSIDNHVSGKPCVAVYGKDVLEKLFPVFGAEVQNDSDSMTDYFESDRIRFFEDHPLYAAARAAGMKKKAADEDRWNRKNAKPTDVVPAYNRHTDGDYSRWLAFNNID